MAESRSSRGTRTAGRPRRNRPREETRALLLEAAARVTIARVSPATAEDHNLLADIRITDVLAEVNRSVVGSERGARMTTGAFYQIWPNQAAFQRELLAHIMDQIAVPGANEVEKLAFELVADGVPAAEIFRQVNDSDFEATRTTPELFLALGLGALASPEMVREAQAEANEKYVASVDHLFSALLRYAGRRLRPDRTMEDLVWATEALAVGYLLRSRTHPDIPERSDSNGWSARATAFLGVIDAFTEPAERA
ncbi:hypothetical protein [Amycolatopsis jejuensis]|uniref:hypothetical protein n=1 Tax=Amycolatopsis jejuensis TaxID=330084 RepID=UPI000527977E|nr:hypothetical protein [Amycolatopsis jejuensis]